MGLSDRDIVALSGGHTLVTTTNSLSLQIFDGSLNMLLWTNLVAYVCIQGRAHKERSDYEGPWTQDPLKFDNSYFV